MVVIFPNLIANDYKLHVVVNGLVTFWLISTNDNRWTQIKNKIRLDESLNDKQQKQLWDILKEFQEVFAWHEGGLEQCFVREHSIDTQGLPPCHMMPG